MTSKIKGYMIYIWFGLASYDYVSSTVLGTYEVNLIRNSNYEQKYIVANKLLGILKPR